VNSILDNEVDWEMGKSVGTNPLLSPLNQIDRPRTRARNPH